MRAKDHPNNAPGIPMRFPPAVARVQNKYLNPTVRRAAPYLPSFAIVHHRGRTSGKPYETVVNAYRKGPVLAIMLGHGKADWVKNVLAAGEADVHAFHKDLHITNPRVVPVGTTDDKTLPWIVRQGARGVGVFVADIA
jgi:deazaflavin-dependent oxidoreductase (nitroreductase family)